MKDYFLEGRLCVKRDKRSHGQEWVFTAEDIKLVIQNLILTINTQIINLNKNVKKNLPWGM